MILLEGIAMCFWLLLICVVGIADGPQGLATFYEKEVQDRLVEQGILTKEEIKKQGLVSSIALFIPMFTLVPFMVYSINGARGFLDGFVQLTSILMIMGLFDRLFIDWYWVGHTKAWVIPGTEDLRPYIPALALKRKWLGTMIGYPLLAALIAGIMHWIG